MAYGTEFQLLLFLSGLVCPIDTPHQDDSIPFDILPQSILILPWEILRVREQKKDQMVDILEYWQVVIQCHLASCRG